LDHPRRVGLLDGLVLLKCRCRCPTCRELGRFWRSHEVDAAVAALPVGCSAVDPDGGIHGCCWSGTLEEFHDHEHVFADQQLQPQATTGTETRVMRKRRRSEHEGGDDDDENDDAVSAAPPARKMKK